MDILVINAGSSSIKYQLINMNDESLLASGIVERIGTDTSTLQHQSKGKDRLVKSVDIQDHSDAMKIVIEILLSKEYGVISSIEEICAVGHRVAHGGDEFFSAVLIDSDVINAIRKNSELAPLHNPANIIGIEACKSLMPDKPMVAVFDTAFHQTLPKKAYLYGISYEISRSLKIRRYGFHGTSHKFIASEVAKTMGKDVKELKIISCHLGNGSSIAAIKNGYSIDTSMGFTPLEGLVMGSRSGDIDPSIIQYLMKKKQLSIDEVINYLNKECGVKGISGKSFDFRDLWMYSKEGHERSKIAIELFCYRVKKYIGAYTAAMGGVDAIAISGGIGENDEDVRVLILEDLDYLGVKIATELNNERGVQKVISAPESKVHVMVVLTNEELMIARETAKICEYDE